MYGNPESITRICCLIGSFQAKRGQRKRFQGLLPESQGQNLALTVLHVLYSLDSGLSKVNADTEMKMQGMNGPASHEEEADNGLDAALHIINLAK